MIDRLQLFLNFVTSGAWPFLVREVICLVDSDNERDPFRMFESLGFYNLRNDLMIVFPFGIIQRKKAVERD